ncbi:MAG: T9SS type A sorting domain-containing protein [Candidatus Stygibacter frigidus]|nr:T9SS type A sorting domain-containing protein [Candidatus Stygibacter frigidus]
MKKIYFVLLLVVWTFCLFAIVSEPSETVGYIRYDLGNNAASGYNIISLSLGDHNQTNCFELLSEIPGCSAISEFLASEQCWRTYDDSGWVAEWALQDCQSYLIHVSEAGSWYSFGELPEPVTYNFYHNGLTGYNLFMLPLNLADLYNCELLFEDIGNSCLALSQWNSAEQSWQVYEGEGELLWETRIGNGYIVTVSENMVWQENRLNNASKIVRKHNNSRNRNLTLPLPKNVGTLVELESGEIPEDVSIDWRTYINSSPGDTLTKSNNDCAYYPSTGMCKVNIGNFNGEWCAGDTLVWEFYLVDELAGEFNIILNESGESQYNINPVILDSTALITKYKVFVSGWNWFSLNIAAADMSVDNVLASLDENGANIKSQSQSSIYYPGIGWFGSLVEIDNLTFYKIGMETADTLVYSGVPVELANTEYDLNSGWNWISYAPQTPEDINYALASIEGSGANIKSLTQSSIYYDGVGWFGSLTDLQPLDGYMLNMNSPDTLIYPTSLPMVRNEYICPDFYIEDTGWKVDPHDYEYNAVIISQIFPEKDYNAMDYELAAFCGDECRGIAEILDYTSPFGGVFHSLMVYSNLQQGEELNFKLYDKVNGRIIAAEEKIAFNTDMVTGDYYEPVIFEALVGDSIDEIPQVTELLHCYPNPFNPEINIEYALAAKQNICLEIYNIKGQKVLTLINKEVETGTHNITWNANNFSSGIYLLKFQANDCSATRKLVLLK